MLVGAGARTSPRQRSGRDRRRRTAVAALVALTVVGGAVQAVPLLTTSPPAAAPPEAAGPPGTTANPLPDGVRAPGWGPPLGTKWDATTRQTRPETRQDTTKPPAGSQPAMPPHTAPAGADVFVSNQEGDGRTVSIDRVEIAGTRAVVVVRGDAGGQPGPFLGWVALKPGPATDVEVTLEEPLTATGRVWIDVHHDDGPVGRFTFPDGDPPLRQPGTASRRVVTYEVQS